MHSRNPVNSINVFLLALILVSCGVKDRATNVNEPHVSTGSLPDGVTSTKNRKFLIRPSSNSLSVGDQSIVYKIVTDEIDLPTAPEYSYTVKYWMTDMPQMGVPPAKIENIAAGQVKINYGISMGGKWEIDVTIYRNGTLVDSLSSQYTVPE